MEILVYKERTFSFGKLKFQTNINKKNCIKWELKVAKLNCQQKTLKCLNQKQVDIRLIQF